jgi:hypothetical protein
LPKSDSVHSSVCIALEIFNNLQHAGASKSVERLRLNVLLAYLRQIESEAHRLPHIFRELAQISPRPPDK